jgi:hypothetical protein
MSSPITLCQVGEAEALPRGDKLVHLTHSQYTAPALLQRICFRSNPGTHCHKLTTTRTAFQPAWRGALVRVQLQLRRSHSYLKNLHSKPPSVPRHHFIPVRSLQQECISMSSAAPTPDKGSRADGRDAASKDPWAKALGRLPPEEQKQFSDLELGMLGVLKGVRIAPPVVPS